MREVKAASVKKGRKENINDIAKTFMASGKIKTKIAKPNPTFEGAIEPLSSNKEQSFWMVFLENRSSPTKKHESEFDALQEAIRLSNKEKTNSHVLKVVKTVTMIPYIQTIK